jgi:hypothetical protein
MKMVTTRHSSTQQHLLDYIKPGQQVGYFTVILNDYFDYYLNPAHQPGTNSEYLYEDNMDAYCAEERKLEKHFQDLEILHVLCDSQVAAYILAKLRI